MIDKLTEILKEVFNSNKQSTMRWLHTQGYATWKDVEKLDALTLTELIKKLEEMRGRKYITWVDGDYTYTRPEDIKNVRELTWTIKGSR